MQILNGNTVKTEHSEYSFPTREQAEAFFLMLKSRESASASPERTRPAARRPAAKPRPAA